MTTGADPSAAPLTPSVGVVALVPDDWYSSWQPRHYLLNRLATHFRVAWVSGALGWRQTVRLLARPPATRESLLVQRPPLLPKLYKPKSVAGLFDHLRAEYPHFDHRRLRRAAQTLREHGCRHIVLYVWRPQFAWALDTVPHDLSCYHIDDEYTFSSVDMPIQDAELQLLRRVDQVFVHSPALLAKKGRLNRATRVVPNGVEFDAYATPQPEPPDLRHIPRPRIGYTGVLKWTLDWRLLTDLARRHPERSFVFVGPEGHVQGVESRIAEFRSLPNVHLLGRRPVADLPAYVQHFDVGMLCYVVDDYTKYIYPLKMHEYLASGLPVIGTPIRTLADYPQVVRIAANAGQWSLALAEALDPAARSPDKVLARQAVARNFDWQRLAAGVADVIRARLGLACGTQAAATAALS